MKQVEGVSGYDQVVEPFISATGNLDFDQLHGPYLELIPDSPALVLDLGAGIGRDAAELAARGHSVVAVEPMAEFRAAAQSIHPASNIRWVDDCLPELSQLDSMAGQFDFVLASAVWHHLTVPQREIAMLRIASLLRMGGVFALSLRNGPAGAGTHCFPTDHRQTIKVAARCGLTLQVAVTNQPSLCPGKAAVNWAKLAFQRCHGIESNL